MLLPNLASMEKMFLYQTNLMPLILCVSMVLRIFGFCLKKNIKKFATSIPFFASLIFLNISPNYLPYFNKTRALVCELSNIMFVYF